MPDQWQKHAKQQHRKLVTNPRIRRILSLVIVLAIIVCAALAIACHDALNFDQIRRSMAYRNVAVDEDGSTETFVYSADSSSRFAAFDGGLLVASGSGYTQFDADGLILAQENTYIENPVINTGKTLAVVFDAGGQLLRGVDSKGLAFVLDLQEPYGIFSARVNKSGWLALTAQESGYKGAVTIYNEDRHKVFQWNSTSQFVTDAVVSEDCNWMAAITLDAADTSMNTSVVIYKLNREEEYASCPLGALVPLDLTFDSDGIRIVGGTACLNISKDGTLEGRYSYKNYYLRDFSTDGDGFTALLLGKYRLGGGQSILVLLDKNCEVIGSMILTQEVMSISAAGRYITILYADSLEVYTDKLNLYASYSGTGSAREAITREDGSILLVSADSARLYLP